MSFKQLTYQTRLIEYQQTREQWLNRAAAAIGDLGFLPLKGKDYRVSCGWPVQGALSHRSRRIGECWYPVHSTDRRTSNIFISPCLENPIDVLATLAHELIHVAVGPDVGHKGGFVRLAKAMGFTKPWTSTPLGPELRERLNGLLAALGSYPHAAIDRSLMRKQGTRLLKVVCPQCGYTVRVTRQWVDRGLPVCPCGTEMNQA